MALRRDPTAPFDYSITQRRGDDSATDSSTELAPAALHDDQRWGFFAELRLPGTAIFAHTADDGTPITEIRAADGSWAVAGHTSRQGRFPVIQAGPRRLWDDIERAHQEWTKLGRPSWQSLGLTVTPPGQRGGEEVRRATSVGGAQVLPPLVQAAQARLHQRGVIGVG